MEVASKNVDPKAARVKDVGIDGIIDGGVSACHVLELLFWELV